MRLPSQHSLNRLTCSKGAARCNVAFPTSTTQLLQKRVLLTATAALQSRHLPTTAATSAAARRSPLQWSHIAHRIRSPSFLPSVGAMAKGPVPAGFQARPHSHGHSHGHGHHHHHDNTYLTSSNKSDPGVRITRVGLYVNLGMAIAKGAGGYVFNSQA